MKLSDVKNLDENVIAGYGDWQIGEHNIGYISKQMILSHYEHIRDIKLSIGIKKIMKIDTSDFYIVGDFITKGDETKFEELFQITFKPTKIPNHSVTYMNVEGVKVPDTLRGRGIALTMYRFFSKELKFNILGDETQYFGARKLWAKLSKMVDVKVDIIDITDGHMIEADAVLRHGSDDWDFDDRVWSYDLDKKDIRLILKEL